MQSLILLCAFVLLNFKQLKKWSPKGSNSFPQEHILYDEMCLRGRRSLRSAVVLNAWGEKRKKRLVLGGSVNALDVFELRRHGRMVLNNGSFGWVNLETVVLSSCMVMNLERPLRGISEMM